MIHVGAMRFPVLMLTTLGVLVMTPNLARAQNAAGSKSDDYFNFIELNVYGGYGKYTKLTSSPPARIEGGGLMGARITENAWNYFALEQDFGFYSYHKLKFQGPTQGGLPLSPFPLHIYQGSFNGVLHVTPRGSKVRPFVTAGIGAAGYSPNGSAMGYAQGLPPSAGFTNFGSRSEFEGNYGAGVKIQAGPRVGIRLDIRGYIGLSPGFGLAQLIGQWQRFYSVRQNIEWSRSHRWNYPLPRTYWRETSSSRSASAATSSAASYSARPDCRDNFGQQHVGLPGRFGPAKLQRL